MAKSISEEELQNYFLHRKNVNHWSPQTMRICYCGIRFFYTNVLQHDWHIFNILRAQTEHRLPAVLSEEEVLEAGINLRSIQQFLGHARLETTMVYLHLTNKGQQDAWQKINDLMKEL